MRVFRVQSSVSRIFITQGRGGRMKTIIELSSLFVNFLWKRWDGVTTRRQRSLGNITPYCALGSSYLSACFVVMKVHQRHGIPWFLATLPPVLRIHKRSGESNTKVNIVGAARPLKINKQWVKCTALSHISTAETFYCLRWYFYCIHQFVSQGIEMCRPWPGIPLATCPSATGRSRSSRARRRSSCASRRAPRPRSRSRARSSPPASLVTPRGAAPPPTENIFSTEYFLVNHVSNLTCQSMMPLASRSAKVVFFSFPLVALVSPLAGFPLTLDLFLATSGVVTFFSTGGLGRGMSDICTSRLRRAAIYLIFKISYCLYDVYMI